METDIFNHKILCKDCNIEMKSIELTRNGFLSRAIKCPKCNSKIIHPKDEQKFKNFNELKKILCQNEIRWKLICCFNP